MPTAISYRVTSGTSLTAVINENFSSSLRVIVTVTYIGYSRRRDASILRARLHSHVHIHLLIKDTGPNVIAESMQLITGNTAHETTNAKADREHSAKIATTPPLFKPANIYIGVWSTST